MPETKLGVILLNMGGPDALEDVPAYLLNIFRDPFILDMPLGALVRPWLSRIIVKKRAGASAERYRLIGGKTPLNGIAAKQADAIRHALAQRGIAAAAVPGMRYWHPFTEEGLAQFAEQHVHHVVALPMYPAYSRATSRSSLEDFHRAMKKHLPGVPSSQVDRWPALPEYIEFLAQHTAEALHSLGQARWPHTAVLFSAHSVPMRLIERGDPYKDHIEQTYRLVCERLPQGIRTGLGWQSAVGPARWLEPDSKHLAASLRAGGADHLVVVPLGFAAENIETLWDIEIDLRAFAREQGFDSFLRVACPNDDRAVMDGLARLIAETQAEGTRHGD